MGRLFLCDCQAGDLVEDVYVIANKQFAQANNGTQYIKAFVSDRTCQMNARMWKATRDIFNAIPDGGFLRLRGRVENYQNNLQIIIENTWPAKEGTFDVGDLMPHTEKNISKMCAKLQEILGSIQNRHLAAIVQVYLDDSKLMEDFCRAPAAQSFHHAFIGGLLEHTLNVIEVADAIVKFYPGLNRDLVVTGLFLHDIAKTWELQYQSCFGYSDGGHLIGHIVKSAIWLEEKVKAAEQMLGEKIPRTLIDALQHVILSHHEKPEFGAAKVPMTPEAVFVSMIDNLDAKMMIVLQACRGEFGGKDASDGPWTEYIKAMSGKLYRPDHAPAEVTESVEAEPPAADAPTLKLALNNPMFETSKPKNKNP